MNDLGMCIINFSTIQSFLGHAALLAGAAPHRQGIIEILILFKIKHDNLWTTSFAQPIETEGLFILVFLQFSYDFVFSLVHTA